MDQKVKVTKESQYNQSVYKVLRIMELLAEEREPMRLLDISKSLKINSSTALRFLATLEKYGYVTQEKDTSKYYLTFKICTLANKVSSGIDIRDTVRPYLKQLSKVFGESTCLGVEQDMKIVYIDVVEGPDQMLRSMQRIGNIAPMHCTGIGKLFLLNYSDLEVDKFIEIIGLKRFTENTLTSKEQLLDELAKIRECGYAYDNEECEIGARCVAFPIYDYTNKVVAGMSITGPSSRLTDSFINSRLQYLDKAATEISQKMGMIFTNK